MKRHRISGLLAILGALLTVALGATAAAAQVILEPHHIVDTTRACELLTG